MLREKIAKTMCQGWRIRPWKKLSAAVRHGEHRSPILMDEDMCPCFREGWDSCAAILNARQAKSAAYWRGHPLPPGPPPPATPGIENVAQPVPQQPQEADDGRAPREITLSNQSLGFGPSAVE